MDLEPDGRAFRAPDPEGDQLVVKALLGAFLLAAVSWIDLSVLGIRGQAALWSSAAVFVLALLGILYRSAPHEPFKVRRPLPQTLKGCLLTLRHYLAHEQGGKRLTPERRVEGGLHIC